MLCTPWEISPICKIHIHFNRWRSKFNHLPAVPTYRHLQHFKKFEEDEFQETSVTTDEVEDEKVRIDLI